MQTALIMMPFSPQEIQRLAIAAEGRCNLLFGRADWSREQWHTALRSADIILGDPLPEDLLLCTRLKWMQTSWDGVEHYLATGHFDGERILQNMAGAYGQIIAEFVVGAVLALCHRFSAYLAQMYTSSWRKMGPHKTLEGTTVLILGVGDIGTEVARKLRAFDCQIIGIRRSRRQSTQDFDVVAQSDKLNMYLPLADIVICCVPSTKETDGLFNKERFLRMKRDAIFVNVGRGSLVVSDDLAAVMGAGHLWGAALDVTSPEPLPPEHPLWQQKNLLLTPHVSGNCFSFDSPTMRRIHEIMLCNFEAHMSKIPM